jgi:hypothetical protein
MTDQFHPEQSFNQQANKLENAVNSENFARAGAMLLDEFDKNPGEAMALIQKEQRREDATGSLNRIDIQANGDVIVHKGNTGVYAGHILQGQAGFERPWAPVGARSESFPPPARANDNAILPASNGSSGGRTGWSQVESSDLTVQHQSPPLTWKPPLAPPPAEANDNANLPADNRVYDDQRSAWPKPLTDLSQFEQPMPAPAPPPFPVQPGPDMSYYPAPPSYYAPDFVLGLSFGHSNFKPQQPRHDQGRPVGRR